MSISDTQIDPFKRYNIKVSLYCSVLENPLANIRRISPSSAYISYHPTAAQQLEASELGIAGQFIVEYDVERDLDAGEIQV